MKEDPRLHKARRNVVDNIEALQFMLSECTDMGMQDLGDAYYNELLDLKETAHSVKSFEELLEVITLAKRLEDEIDAWGSLHGRSSISLVWPTTL